MAIHGPNCLGIINYRRWRPADLRRDCRASVGERPGIGIVSQSGAMAAVLA